MKEKTAKPALQRILSFTQWSALLILVAYQALMMVMGYLGPYVAVLLGAILVFVLAKKKQIDLKAILPYHLRPDLRQIGLAVLLFFACRPWSSLAYNLTLKLFPDTIGSAVSAFSGFIPLFYLALIGPAGEEFMIRGLMFGGMRRSSRVIFATVASALFFGVMHGNFSQIFCAALIGLVFAWEREVTGSLWVPTIHHVLNNTLEAFLVIAGNHSPAMQNFAARLSLDLYPEHGLAYNIVLFVVGTAVFFLCLFKWLRPTAEAAAEKERLEEENKCLMEEAAAGGSKLRLLRAPYWIGIAAFLIMALSQLYVDLFM